MTFYHFDVKSTFLNGEIAKDVYAEQPKGILIKGKEDSVHKLNKALYGLKQAPRAWFRKIDTYLIKLGFKRSPNAHTFYKKTNGEEKILLVYIYVDDIVFMGSSTALIEELKNHMKETFEMLDLGQLNYFFGLEVMQSFDGVFVC